MSTHSEALRALSLDLRRKEAVFWSILDTAGEGLITADVGGRIELFNSAAERLFGFGPQEIHGSPVGDLFEGLELGRLKKSSLLRTRGIRKGGESFDAEVTTSTLEVFDKDLVILVVRDITERLEQQAISSQSQKLESIGQLAAGIAHEINTPTQFVGDNVRFLSGAIGEVFAVLKDTIALVAELESQPEVSSLVRALAEDLEELDFQFLEKEVPQAIAQSIEGVERVAGIVRAMKNFSHPGSLGLGLVDLNQAIQNTLTVSRSEWKYQAELELQLDESLPLACCAEGEINQVILNMIVNASHAIEAARGKDGAMGKLTIGTRVVEDEVLITIADTGCGMPPEVQERIFDPFYTTKGVGKGTGQGLALANNVIRAHDGSIDVDSVPGAGTTFTIHLPLAGPGEHDD